MSEVISPENPANETAPVLTGGTTNGQAVPVEFEVNEFKEGDFKGFKFTVPVFNTLDAVVGTYGQDKVLSLLNTQIDARIRTKVKNGLPKELTGTALAAKQAELMQKHVGGLLFTQDDAASWRPEVRELSPNQLFKKAKESFAEANKTQDPALKAELMVKGQNFLIEAGKAMAA
jgi:hypothetical protein